MIAVLADFLALEIGNWLEESSQSLFLLYSSSEIDQTPCKSLYFAIGMKKNGI